MFRYIRLIFKNGRGCHSMRSFLRQAPVYGLVLGLAWNVLAMEEPTALSGTFNISFKKELEKTHPRLLFTKAEMERWAKEDRTPQQFIWDADTGYFRTCKSPPP